VEYLIMVTKNNYQGGLLFLVKLVLELACKNFCFL